MLMFVVTTASVGIMNHLDITWAWQNAKTRVLQNRNHLHCLLFYNIKIQGGFMSPFFLT